MKINTLIFEGGGIKGLSYVGALKELEENNIIDLENIKYVGGTSAGAIVATLIASEHSTSDMHDILFNTNWGKFKDGRFMSNIFRLINQFGFYKGNYLEKFIESILYKKFNKKNVTFIELYQLTKKHLKIIGTNLSRSEIVYMDYILTPDMPIAKGVQISACIPIVFKPVKYANDLYIDGSLLKNLDTCLFSTEPNVNGIAFDLIDDVIHPDKKLTDYILSIIQMLVTHVNKIEDNPDISRICIDVSFVNPLKFKLEDCEKRLLVIQGAQAARNHKVCLWL